MTLDAAEIQAIALLAEPVRRSLYEWVISAGRPVAKDEVADGTGVSRSLVAFHLDRLVDAGLLDAEFRRRSGRSGPGAGRPAKLYRRSHGAIGVTVPARHYDVAGELLAQALDQGPGEGPPPELVDAARGAGRAVGRSARGRAGARPPRRLLRRALVEALSERGYEPRAVENDRIVLGNCPFHALAREHRDLVCGMNLALAEGILEGIGRTGFTAHLDPNDQRCCVVFDRQ